MAEPTHKGRSNARGFARDLDDLESAQDFLPENFQLQFGQPVADAAVDAETKGQVLARSLAIDDEAVRLTYCRFVAVARQVPHRQLVALLDLLTRQFRVGQRRSPHV